MEGVECCCHIQILSFYVLVMRVQVHRIIMGNFTSRLGNSGHHACVRMTLNLFMGTVCVSPFCSSAIYMLGYNSGTLLCVTQRDFYCCFWKLPLLFPEPSYMYDPLLLVLMGILPSHSQFVTSAAFRSYFPLICNILRFLLSICSCRFKCINDAVFYGVSGVLALWLGKFFKRFGLVCYS